MPPLRLMWGQCGLSQGLGRASWATVCPLANYHCVLYQTSRAGVELKMFTLSHYSSKYLLSVRGAGAEEEQGQTGCLGPEGLMGEQPWGKDTGGREGDGRESTLSM